jgi:hypothetical protein
MSFQKSNETNLPPLAFELIWTPMILITYFADTIKRNEILWEKKYYQEHIIVYISPQWVIARSL